MGKLWFFYNLKHFVSMLFSSEGEENVYKTDWLFCLIYCCT